MNAEPLMPPYLEELRALSTCVVASAIETFGVRLRNRGFSDARLHCMFPEQPAAVGYAATARIRGTDPPMEGHSYYDRGAWWNSLLKIPPPRIVVIEDADSIPGLGGFIGEVHANILLALGCVAVVTNGAVRDLPEVRRSGLQLFAGNVSLSHAYAHVFDFGGTVEIAGLTVRPGELIQGDLHGVQTIPPEIAARVPEKAREIMQSRKELIGLCYSKNFSIAEFIQKAKELES
ncbi:MAG: RraA family protein [Candidatus Acidiferrales bacterium]|jgi:4-hydroxy-4-methyl-2-oxoglutarate aldolase